MNNLRMLRTRLYNQERQARGHELLSIIIVGQNVQAAASDQRAENTYQDAEAVLHEALQIQDHLLIQDQELQRLIATLC